MKILISQQQNKKLLVEFHHGEVVSKHSLDKAEEFLLCIDKLTKKHHTVKISDFRNAKLEFRNTGLLTERVIRAIMLGLSFSKN